ncbi:hypothetical protein JRG42_24270 [Pseudomonas granadensis]|uniref:hypothetical protein n=1 Tax=Pseudomonas granadensis TaxID=1421430 RepID=UPI0019D001A0|nr:hypothetical protein [Pseudomonas granadensis]MBN6776323.1 hypothetical protein [Pseudomonas granadensis]MBN6807430.1 hypothetical protein [Pseudomonas granadensis]MBN6834292.1 hypothetical protein [Pseudomonas granadensis]MBN6841805.1 hypothetical protein [Pseudomonas granadensis]MBN6870480.1 hypothetical protein [Pseudomonas granadensis]
MTLTVGHGIGGRFVLVGSVGLIGVTGLVDATGRVGATGLVGGTGRIGTTGLVGVVGRVGVTGVVGLTGRVGVTGVVGLTGRVGVTGVVGLTGRVGVTGLGEVTEGRGRGTGALAIAFFTVYPFALREIKFVFITIKLMQSKLVIMILENLFMNLEQTVSIMLNQLKHQANTRYKQQAVTPIFYKHADNY